MDFKTSVFYLLSTILVFAALRVITARNPVHAALFLVLSFFTASGIWLLLQAEFLAIALILVYVGAVMVLFLFVVMMLDINIDRLREGFWSYLPLGSAIGLLIAVEMGAILYGQYSGMLESKLPAVAQNSSNTKALGRLIYSDYVYPFELASIILLVAIIAAIALTYRGRKSRKLADPAKQVLVKAKDRLRVLQMNAEKND